MKPKKGHHLQLYRVNNTELDAQMVKEEVDLQEALEYCFDTMKEVEFIKINLGVYVESENGIYFLDVVPVDYMTRAVFEKIKKYKGAAY